MAPHALQNALPAQAHESDRTAHLRARTAEERGPAFNVAASYKNAQLP